MKIALFENFFLKNCDFLQFLENFVVFCIFLIIDSDFCIFDNFFEIYRKFPIILYIFLIGSLSFFNFVIGS